MVQYTQLPEMGGWPEKPIDRAGSNTETGHWVCKAFCLTFMRNLK